jgi:hypothetical protein
VPLPNIRVRSAAPNSPMSTSPSSCLENVASLTSPPAITTQRNRGSPYGLLAEPSGKTTRASSRASTS